VITRSRGLLQGMAMLEAPVLPNSVSTGSKPYASGRIFKKCSSVKGAGYRNALKVARGQELSVPGRRGVVWCGNEKCQAASPLPSQLCEPAE
jgi:hypothetical protein